MRVTPILAFHDNYIWAIHDEQHLIVVDPGDAKPVLDFIANHQLQLTAIFITHHHHDHVGGIKDLVAHQPQAKVYGPSKEQIPGLSQSLQQGDKLSLNQPNCEFQILDIPGHTLGHIAYVGSLGLFCGDTLFHAGCGRLFEGSPEQMQNSLTKLKQLPETTLVYCAHEYTESNLNFAQVVEPDNSDLIEVIKKVKQLRDLKQPSLPSSIQEQKKINPFLRCHSNTLKNNVERWCQKHCQSPLDVFTQLRRWKDQF